jgi:hypothetical protein
MNRRIATPRIEALESRNLLSLTAPSGPVAADDTYRLPRGASLDVGAPGILANDSGDGVLTPVLIARPVHGALTLRGDGSFTYTPNSGYSGGDDFTYQVSDGALHSNTAVVYLNTIAPPVAAGDHYAARSGVPLTVGAGAGVLANDFDVNGPPRGFPDPAGPPALPLSATLLAGPAHGSLGLQADGSFTYTANARYAGPDHFVYRVSNGIATATATADLVVKAPANDYDGDGRSDVAVYSPADGTYHIRYSGGGSAVTQFGAAGVGNSIPAPGDYDGDGRADLAVYMPGAGKFAYRPSGGGPDVVTPFGTAGAGQSIPAPGDYDGDGKADLAGDLADSGTFAYRPTGGGYDVMVPFGAPGHSIPVPGDFDGSGRDELAVFMPDTAVFAYRPAQGGADVTQQFGAAGGRSLPAAGDYTGSGRDQIAVYMPDPGTFAIRPGSGPDRLIDAGTAGDRAAIPVTAVDAAIALIAPDGLAARKKAAVRA